MDLWEYEHVEVEVEPHERAFDSRHYFRSSYPHTHPYTHRLDISHIRNDHNARHPAPTSTSTSGSGSGPSADTDLAPNPTNSTPLPKGEERSEQFVLEVSEYFSLLDVSHHFNLNQSSCPFFVILMITNRRSKKRSEKRSLESVNTGSIHLF